MNHPTVDMRSDTVTRPTPAMRQAMAAAEVGDDVYADDPTVNALQQRLAELLGFQDALFVPTGTQSNLCAIMAHCERGDEYLVGQMQHTYRWEAGGAAVMGSVQPQPIAHQPDGTLALADIEAAIKPDDVHYARSRLLALENTLGGSVMPLTFLAQASALAQRHGLARHLDGARLFNAAVAQSEGGDWAAAARRITAHFDSVSVCFSKGLGAPVGSMLCGPRAFIQRARRVRKMAGGGMRQAGVLAAAADHALNHHVERLADDHHRAQRLAQAFSEMPGLRVGPVHTNIVFVDIAPEAQALAGGLTDFLAARGVLANGLYRLRFVTHLDVDDAGVDRAIAAMQERFGA